MPWWAWTWIGVMAVVTIAAFVVGLRDGSRVFSTLFGFVLGAACVVLALGYFGQLEVPMPGVVGVVTALGLLFEARDEAKRARELSRGEAALGATLSLLLFLPAAGLGMTVWLP